MTILIIFGILSFCGLIGKISGDAGVFEATNAVSPFLTVGLFLFLLIVLTGAVKRRK